MEKTKISSIVIIGDSLSDRGQLAAKRPMVGKLAGAFNNPTNRFSDARVWGDYFGSSLIRKQVTKDIERLKSEIQKLDKNSPGFIKKKGVLETEITKLKDSRPDLSHHRKVRYKGERFMRTYAEGGVTSHKFDMRSSPKNIQALGARATVSNLAKKRDQFLRDDTKYRISAEDKKKTLIAEWSGANDLLTVNTTLSEENADLAIEQRIKNIESLIENGYQNFSLFNLPDLSLTPRFQSKSPEEQARASEISEYFNKKLEARVNELTEKHPECKMRVFDVNSKVKELLKDPAANGFDPALTKTHYQAHQEGKAQEGKGSVLGYVFNDDVHPSAHAHKIIADAFSEEISQTFDFDIGKEPLSAEKLYDNVVIALRDAIRDSIRDSGKSPDFQSYLIELAQEEAKLKADGREPKKLNNDDYKNLLTKVFQDSENPNCKASKVLEQIIEKQELNTSEIHPDLIEARKPKENEYLSMAQEKLKLFQEGVQAMDDLMGLIKSGDYSHEEIELAQTVVNQTGEAFKEAKILMRNQLQGNIDENTFKDMQGQLKSGIKHYKQDILKPFISERKNIVKTLQQKCKDNKSDSQFLQVATKFIRFLDSKQKNLSLTEKELSEVNRKDSKLAKLFSSPLKSPKKGIIKTSAQRNDIVAKARAFKNKFNQIKAKSQPEDKVYSSSIQRTM
jgi:phospholipase/lecithinase/hemolysin